MKARIFVTLKPGVLDPQGRAIHHALGGLGFEGVNDVRAGKLIELDVADGTSDATTSAQAPAVRRPCMGIPFGRPHTLRVSE